MCSFCYFCIFLLQKVFTFYTSLFLFHYIKGCENFCQNLLWKPFQPTLKSSIVNNAWVFKRFWLIRSCFRLFYRFSVFFPFRQDCQYRLALVGSGFFLSIQFSTIVNPIFSDVLFNNNSFLFLFNLSVIVFIDKVSEFIDYLFLQLCQCLAYPLFNIRKNKKNKKISYMDEKVVQKNRNKKQFIEILYKQSLTLGVKLILLA